MRPGHLYEECRTRLAEERQQNQVKTIIAEQQNQVKTIIAEQQNQVKTIIAEQLSAIRRQLAPIPQPPPGFNYLPNQAIQHNLTTHQAPTIFNPHFQNHGNPLQQTAAGVST